MRLYTPSSIWPEIISIFSQYTNRHARSFRLSQTTWLRVVKVTLAQFSSIAYWTCTKWKFIGVHWIMTYECGMIVSIWTPLCVPKLKDRGYLLFDIDMTTSLFTKKRSWINNILDFDLLKIENKLKQAVKRQCACLPKMALFEYLLLQWKS